MKFAEPLFPARLLKRYKRFLADVRLEDGTELTVHCPNPGSMLGLAAEGAQVYLSDSRNPRRKLRYTLEIVVADEAPVLVNTMRPNAIAREAIEAGRIATLGPYDRLIGEARYGDEKSRIDWLLERGEAKIYVEVKSVTLARAGIGYFPDAVTLRGTKHLRELGRIVRRGQRGVLLFLACRPDVTRVRPADAIDPEYGKTLRLASDSGVEVLAYRCHVNPSGVAVEEQIPVELDSGDEGPRR